MKDRTKGSNVKDRLSVAVPFDECSLYAFGTKKIGAPERKTKTPACKRVPVFDINGGGGGDYSYEKQVCCLDDDRSGKKADIHIGHAAPFFEKQEREHQGEDDLRQVSAEFVQEHRRPHRVVSRGTGSRQERPVIGSECRYRLDKVGKNTDGNRYNADGRQNKPAPDALQLIIGLNRRGLRVVFVKANCEQRPKQKKQEGRHRRQTS